MIRFIMCQKIALQFPARNYVSLFHKRMLNNLHFARFVLTTLILIVILGVLTACAQSGPPAPAAPATAEAPIEAVQEEAPEEEPLPDGVFSPGLDYNTLQLPALDWDGLENGIHDHAGRLVFIDRPVERLISGFYISTSAIIALGLEDKLVGIEARADMRPIYALAAPQLLDLPNVGTARDFNMEAALALEPDLVVLPIRLRDAAEIMEELGVPVILVEPECPDKLIEMFTMISAAMGVRDRTISLIQSYERSLKEVAELTEGITDRPVVYMGGVGTYLSTSPSGMYQSSLIELAGGINAAGDIEGTSRIEVSYEQLLAINPDVIIIPPEAAYTKEDILNNPQLVYLSAVQNGRIYHMPSSFEAWDSPVTSFPLGIRWLLSVLHEDVYPFEDMKEYAAAFHLEFFGVEIDTDLITR